MKFIAAFAACVALGASAQSIDDFRDRAPIGLPAKASLYRIALPEAAYRDTRADLGDVRVFNARGEPVPVALAMEPEAKREAPAPVELTAFALTTLDPARIVSQVTVRLADGTRLAVDAHGKVAAQERRVVGYILDASGLKEPIYSLAIDWEVLPAQQAIKVRVEGSDDLRTWTPLTGTVALLRIEQAGRTLEQSRVPLEGTRAKYLRLLVVDTPFTLRSATAEFQERAQPADLAVKRVAGKPGSKPGEAVYDLGARLPVEAVRIVPAEGNSVIAANLFVRDTPEGTPSWIAQSAFYRLARDGAEIESPPAAIRRRAARYWILRTDPEKGGFGTAIPELEVRWRPVQLVFVARGEEPFTLAFGRREAMAATLPITSVMPGYEPHAEMKLPEASVGRVERAASALDAWPEWLQDVSPRKAALWAVLLGAVALLAFMAWRLGRTTR